MKPFTIVAFGMLGLYFFLFALGGESAINNEETVNMLSIICGAPLFVWAFLQAVRLTLLFGKYGIGVAIGVVLLVIGIAVNPEVLGIIGLFVTVISAILLFAQGEVDPDKERKEREIEEEYGIIDFMKDNDE